MPRPKKTVPIDLGDLGIHHLRMDFNVLATIENMTDKNLLTQEAWEDMTATSLRVIVWAMLSWEPNPPTLEQVGAEIDLENIAYISECIGKVVSTEKPEDVEENPTTS